MNYNLTIMAGNLTRDPELRQAGEATICKLSIANNRKYKDREFACFLDCQAWGKTADMIADYFKKGSRIFLEGQLQFEQWEDKDGSKRSKHVLNVQGFKFVDKKETKNAPF